MPKGTCLPQKELGCIRALKHEAVSISPISELVCRSRDAILRYLSNPDSYRNRKRARGDANLGLRSHLLLLQEASKGHQTSSQLQLSLELPMSRRRVHQILAGTKHLKYTKAKLPSLPTAKHETLRLNFPWEKPGRTRAH